MAETCGKDQDVSSEIGIPSGLNRIRTRLVSTGSKPDESRSYGVSRPPVDPKQKTVGAQGHGRTTGSSKEEHKRKKLSRWFATYISKHSSYFVRNVPPNSEDARLKVKVPDKDECLRAKSSENNMYFSKVAKGLKSFSHELGPRGGIQNAHPRAHSYNDLKELLGSLHSRFDVAKGIVDEELEGFARDVANAIEKLDLSSPEERAMVEDLQNLAQMCIEMTSSQLRSTCESIVQDLTQKRQLCQTGPVKWLFTQMLFILTRCTRLLMFQKETEPIDEKSFRRFKECLDSIPAVETNWVSTSGVADSGSSYSAYQDYESEQNNNVQVKESSVPETSWFSSTESVHQSDGAARKDFLVAKHRFPLQKSLFDIQTEERFHFGDVCQEGTSLDDSACGLVNELQERLHGTFNEPGQELGDSIICRICEEVVPFCHLEPHSYICAYADKCEINCMDVDERLLKIEEILEQIIDSRNSSSFPHTCSLENPVLQTTISGIASEGCSPKVSEWRNKGVEGMFEDLHEMDAAFIDDLYLQPINLKTHIGVKLCNNGASSSTGSMTSVSSTNTPRTSHFDSFWLERNSSEQEDIQLMIDLADIARCAAGTDLSKEDSCDYLLACMQDLQDVLKRSKLKALVIDTFGGRIEKLLREKYIYACELADVKSPISHSKHNENVVNNASLTSSASTTHLLHKDRTSIDDFEIIKPISRGAFGKVLLARKRTTGDLFAIKVLKKMDMIRKNDIERILAERNILITVRNPFVVRFFYSFTCRDNLYLVMEYLNGGDLYSLLRKIGCLEEDIARIYIAELVLALEYLHSLGIVHRDLKPDNILIAHDGHIKLTDFGLSQIGLINNTIDLSGHETDVPTTTDSRHLQQKQTEDRSPNSAVGTPDYLAPEILLGTEHGSAADWWSVGIILFELITGVPPFTAERPEIIFDNILNGKIPWPSVPDDISYEAQDLINRFLIHDPNQRLGANGSTEVKSHPFFEGIDWDNLAMQKAAFVPQPDSIDDTSYFVSRFSQISCGVPGNENCTGSDTDSCESYSGDEVHTKIHSIVNSFVKLQECSFYKDAHMDECGNLAEFESSPLNLSLINFSFKNLSQLASINHDVLLQTGKDLTKSSPYKSPRT